MPFAPPANMVLLTARQRKLVQAKKPGLYFMALVALVGTTSFEGASTAVARASCFRQTFGAVSEAWLAGQVIMDATRFRFGALEVTSVARGRSLEDCAPSSLSAIALSSLAAESQLRSLLSTFESTDSEEQAYVREWGQAVQAFDPSEIPEDACALLPRLQQQSLASVPFSFPTPVVATLWAKPPTTLLRLSRGHPLCQPHYAASLCRRA